MLQYITCSAPELRDLLRRTACYGYGYFYNCITCSAPELRDLLRRTACYGYGYFYNCITCSAPELRGLLRRTACYGYGYFSHILALLFISVNINETLYQLFYELATFTF